MSDPIDAEGIFDDSTWIESKSAVNIAIVFTALSLACSFTHITRHLANYTVPQIQIFVIRILLTCPVYAVTSLLAMVLGRDGVYAEVLRNCYEPFVIYSFMHLILEFAGGETNCVYKVENEAPLRMPCPLCCLFPRARDTRLMRFCHRGVLQFIIIKPIMGSLDVAMLATGLYDSSAWQITTILIYNISYGWALYCLYVFYLATKKVIKNFRPLLKFGTVKAIIFATYYQSLFLQLGSLSVPEDAILWDDLLICIEMFVFSIILMFAFPVSEFKISQTSTCSSSGSGGEENGIEVPMGNNRVLQNVNEVLSIRDLWEDVYHNFTPVYRDYALQKQQGLFELHEPPSGSLSPKEPSSPASSVEHSGKRGGGEEEGWGGGKRERKCKALDSISTSDGLRTSNGTISTVVSSLHSRVSVGGDDGELIEGNEEKEGEAAEAANEREEEHWTDVDLDVEHGGLDQDRDHVLNSSNDFGEFAGYYTPLAARYRLRAPPKAPPTPMSNPVPETQPGCVPELVLAPARKKPALTPVAYNQGDLQDGSAMGGVEEGRGEKMRGNSGKHGSVFPEDEDENNNEGDEGEDDIVIDFTGEDARRTFVESSAQVMGDRLPSSSGSIIMSNGYISTWGRGCKELPMGVLRDDNGVQHQKGVEEMSLQREKSTRNPLTSSADHSPFTSAVMRHSTILREAVASGSGRRELFKGNSARSAISDSSFITPLDACDENEDPLSISSLPSSRRSTQPPAESASAFAMAMEALDRATSNAYRKRSASVIPKSTGDIEKRKAAIKKLPADGVSGGDEESLKLDRLYMADSVPGAGRSGAAYGGSRSITPDSYSYYQRTVQFEKNQLENTSMGNIGCSGGDAENAMEMEQRDITTESWVQRKSRSIDSGLSTAFSYKTVSSASRLCDDAGTGTSLTADCRKKNVLETSDVGDPCVLNKQENNNNNNNKSSSSSSDDDDEEEEEEDAEGDEDALSPAELRPLVHSTGPHDKGDKQKQQEPSTTIKLQPTPVEAPTSTVEGRQTDARGGEHSVRQDPCGSEIRSSRGASLSNNPAGQKKEAHLEHDSPGDGKHCTTEDSGFDGDISSNSIYSPLSPTSLTSSHSPYSLSPSPSLLCSTGDLRQPPTSPLSYVCPIGSVNDAAK